MGTWLCASFAQPLKSEKIRFASLTIRYDRRLFTLESLCFQFTHGSSYSTFSARLLKPNFHTLFLLCKLRDHVGVKRLSFFLPLAERENPVSEKPPNSEVKLSSTEIYHQIDIFGA